MTSRSRVIAPDADVLEAAREMLYLDVHRLFVEDAGRLVGVVSETDIVAAVATAKISRRHSSRIAARSTFGAIRQMWPWPSSTRSAALGTRWADLKRE